MFTFFGLSAQVTKPDTATKERRHVIGVEATALLRQFFNSPYSSQYPYQVTYRYLTGATAFRAGMNAFASNGSHETNGTFDRDHSIAVRVGFGIEKYMYLLPRLNFYYGAELIAGFRDSRLVSNAGAFNELRRTYSNYEAGVSPLIGIQYRFHPRISVSTETLYQLTYEVANQTEKYTTISLSGFDRTSAVFRTSYVLPTSIHFRFQF